MEISHRQKASAKYHQALDVLAQTYEVYYSNLYLVEPGNRVNQQRAIANLRKAVQFFRQHGSRKHTQQMLDVITQLGSTKKK
ncbi:MAG: hypothetical protein KME32_08250 [Mojavia pulchra JT2-VF2]|uniref:Uncharacterized protein n=1 Tax=Mojavia pulchra JT2-VF2 TaxID=287848 RepID=A0A951UGL1_9NOST|nr:hypothetical protein [Mojavia pulchra JT2-VF2]